MNKPWSLFLKCIKKLCIVYFVFAIVMLLFLILDEGLKGFHFSLKKTFMVYGFPAFIFFLTKYLIKVNGSE